jgi:NNP family nitrate/nitrite transporter-like MFS transporter
MTTEVSEDEEQAQPASHEIRHVAFAAPNGDDLPISVPYQDDEADAHDPFAATKDSCYARYHVTVDRYAGDRGTEIQLCSTRRPHMRAFHCAWVSFFLAFFVWFAPAPLQREIQKTLHLTEQQLWTSNITNDVMAIVLRSLIGPLCDSYGPRIPMSIVLMVASIPCACVGLIQTAAGLAGIRFCIGIAGSSFVMAQFWPSTMFAQEIVGTAKYVGCVG